MAEFLKLLVPVLFGGLAGAVAASAIQIYYNKKAARLTLAVDIVKRIDRFRWHIFRLKESLNPLQFLPVPLPGSLCTRLANGAANFSIMTIRKSWILP